MGRKPQVHDFSVDSSFMFGVGCYRAWPKKMGVFINLMCIEGKLILLCF